MLKIPREEFVPEDNRSAAYSDEPLGIGYGQTISQPYMTALMVQCLELEGTETVLEVGGGCGYHAAVLGALAARVVTLELIPELATMARENLANTGRLGNVTVIAGDGSLGYPPEAPYDAISVAAAAAGFRPPAPATQRPRAHGDSRRSFRRPGVARGAQERRRDRLVCGRVLPLRAVA